MDRTMMRAPTKAFSLAIIRLVQSLSRIMTADVLCKQLLRSATSVGANYRASGRAKSKPDFIHKLCIVEEEADETLFWMELHEEAQIVEHVRLAPLMREADELTAIVVAAIKQARSSLHHPR